MPGRIDGYYMDLFTSREAFQEMDLPTIPFPGANVFASISLSNVNFQTGGDDASLARGYIASARAYNPDGTTFAVDLPLIFDQNSVRIDNCATIRFAFEVHRGWAIAQVSVFFL
jgi:hypothetical protein